MANQLPCAVKENSMLLLSVLNFELNKKTFKSVKNKKTNIQNSSQHFQLGYFPFCPVVLLF